MENLNEIETIVKDNTIIHICDNSLIKSRDVEKKILINFSNIAYLLHLKEKRGVKNEN